MYKVGSFEFQLAPKDFFMRRGNSKIFEGSSRAKREREKEQGSFVSVSRSSSEMPVLILRAGIEEGERGNLVSNFVRTLDSRNIRALLLNYLRAKNLEGI